jgi:hypothetical protein
MTRTKRLIAVPPFSAKIPSAKTIGAICVRSPRRVEIDLVQALSTSNRPSFVLEIHDRALPSGVEPPDRAWTSKEAKSPAQA